MKIQDLMTPAFVIERSRVQNNCDVMRNKARAAKVVLRPHVKTHKTIEGARLQLGARTGPITVSTLREAEFFASEGFDDITLAVPLPPARIERAVALTRRTRHMGIIIDDPAMAAALEQAAVAHRLRFSVWMEIDSGAHRTGLPADAADTITLAQRLAASPNLRFEGLLTHAGHSYGADTLGERRAVAVDEVQALVGVRRALEALGVEVPVISVGSTPTATAVDAFDGPDEVRPGNYIFFDAWQVALGTCSIDDCAASVLTTVIGVYPSEGRVVVDAGSLALTHEPPRNVDEGWGIVCDLDGNALPFQTRNLTQEHGELLYQPLSPPRTDSEATGRSIGTLRIGSLLRIIPNHACITASMFDRHHVVDAEDVVDEWRPVRGW